MSLFGKYTGGMTEAFNVSGNMDALIKQQAANQQEMLNIVDKFQQTKITMDDMRAKAGAILSTYGTDESGKPDPSAPKYVHDAYNAIKKEGGVGMMSASQLNAVISGYNTGVDAEKKRYDSMVMQRNMRALQEEERLNQAYQKTQEEREKVAKDEEVVTKKETTKTETYDVTTPEGLRRFTTDYTAAKKAAAPGAGVLKKETWERKQPKAKGDAGWLGKSPAELVSDAMKAAKEQESAERKAEVERAKSIAIFRDREGKLNSLKSERAENERRLEALKRTPVQTTITEQSGDTIYYGAPGAGVLTAPQRTRNLNADEIEKLEKERQQSIAKLEAAISGNNTEIEKLEAIRRPNGYATPAEVETYRKGIGEKIAEIDRQLEMFDDSGVKSADADVRAAKTQLALAKTERDRIDARDRLATAERERESTIIGVFNKKKELEEERKRLVEEQKGVPKFGESTGVLRADAKQPDVKMAQLETTQYIEQRDKILRSQEAILNDEYTIMTNYLKANGGLPMTWNRAAFMTLKGYPNISVVPIEGVGKYVSVNGKGEIIKDTEMSLGDREKVRDAALLRQQRSLNNIDLGGNSGYRFTGEIASNSIKDVNTVREELGKSSNALKSVDTLIRIAEDASVLDKMVPGEITGLAGGVANTIAAANRTEIGGSGAWSEADEARLQLIVRDPTKLRNMAFRAEALSSLKAYKQRLLDGMNTKGQTYGFRLSSTPTDKRRQEAAVQRARIAYQTAMMRGLSKEQASAAARESYAQSLE